MFTNLTVLTGQLKKYILVRAEIFSTSISIQELEKNVKYCENCNKKHKRG